MANEQLPSGQAKNKAWDQIELIDSGCSDQPGQQLVIPDSAGRRLRRLAP